MSLYMALLDSREGYDGNQQPCNVYRKLLKRTSFIYLKTRTSYDLHGSQFVDCFPFLVGIYVQFMRNVLPLCNGICILLDGYGTERSDNLMSFYYSFLRVLSIKYATVHSVGCVGFAGWGVFFILFEMYIN